MKSAQRVKGMILRILRFCRVAVLGQRTLIIPKDTAKDGVTYRAGVYKFDGVSYRWTRDCD